jgi:hypothetical protein
MRVTKTVLNRSNNKTSTGTITVVDRNKTVFNI